MKKIIFITILLVLIGSAGIVFANGGDEGHDHGMMGNMMNSWGMGAGWSWFGWIFMVLILIVLILLIAILVKWLIKK